LTGNKKAISLPPGLKGQKPKRVRGPISSTTFQVAIKEKDALAIGLQGDTGGNGPGSRDSKGSVTESPATSTFKIHVTVDWRIRVLSGQEQT